MLYGCEAWTLSSVMMKKIEAFWNLAIQKNVKNIMERQDHQWCSLLSYGDWQGPPGGILLDDS